MNNKVYQEILEFIKNQKIIDTHEHIMPREMVSGRDLDIFSTCRNSYARLDFISAGMKSYIWDSSDYNLKIEAMQKYLPCVEQTGYVRNMKLALKELLDIDIATISPASYASMTKKVRDAYSREDWYTHVYRERANVSVGLIDTYWSVEKFDFDTALFRPVLRVDAFIQGKNYTSPYETESTVETETRLETIADAWGMELDSFDDVLALLDEAFKRYTDASVVAIKIALAYHRPIYFANVSKEDAEQSFLSGGDKTPFQDYMTHLAIQKATELGLPVQIHTGLLAENSCYLNNSDPNLLNNLFRQYPDTKFVIFHFAYPFVETAMVLAKTYPNVYIDLCWVPLISPQVAIQVLDRALDLIPYNKIMWGGDGYRVEEAFGAVLAIQQVLVNVLVSRVEQSKLDVAGAKRIAEAILYKNAFSLFKLS